MTETSVTRGYGLLEGFLAKKRAQITDKLIPLQLRAGKILDIGCGTVPYFLMNTTFHEKHGIDKNVQLSDNIIQLQRFDFETCDKIPFDDNFFDVITMLAVIEHIEPNKVSAILEEIRRILKPNGRLILTTPAPWSDALLRLLAKLKIVSSEEIDDHKAVYSHGLTSHLLCTAGFERAKMNFGYFEIFLNIWGFADK